MDIRGLSLVLPFYNEGAILRHTLQRVWAFLQERQHPFELILGNDGSTDTSLDIAKQFCAAHPDQTILVSNPTNIGKGSILKQSLSRGTMPILAFIDADLEIDLPYLDSMLESLKDPKTRVTIGCKLSTAQPFVRARHRHFASQIYNGLVRIFLHSRLRDHQCGLKAFKKEDLDKALPLTQESGWTWDTELLMILQKQGVPIVETEVSLKSQRPSSVSFVKATFEFIRKLWQFRARGLAL